MNQARRKSLLDLSETLDRIRADIESLRDEEQEYIDNMPESLQQSERAEVAENAVSSMEDAINSIDEAISSLDGSRE